MLPLAPPQAGHSLTSCWRQETHVRGTHARLIPSPKTPGAPQALAKTQTCCHVLPFVALQSIRLTDRKYSQSICNNQRRHLHSAIPIKSYIVRLACIKVVHAAQQALSSQVKRGRSCVLEDTNRDQAHLVVGTAVVPCEADHDRIAVLLRDQRRQVGLEGCQLVFVGHHRCNKPVPSNSSTCINLGGPYSTWS